MFVLKMWKPRDQKGVFRALKRRGLRSPNNPHDANLALINHKFSSPILRIFREVAMLHGSVDESLVQLLVSGHSKQSHAIVFRNVVVDLIKRIFTPALPACLNLSVQ